MGLARSPLTSQTPIQRSVFSRIYASLRETLETTKNPVPKNRGRISRQFQLTVSQVFSPVLSSRAQLQASLQPAPPFEVRAEDVEQADCGPRSLARTSPGEPQVSGAGAWEWAAHAPWLPAWIRSLASADYALKFQDAVCSRNVLRALEFPPSAWGPAEYEP